MKILYITTISLTMNTFFKPHVEMLVKEGHSVDIACNCTQLKIDSLYDELGCKTYQVDFSRTPLTSDNLRAARQLKEVIENGGYDIVHCHTPNASIITRLVCRKFRKKSGLKVFYTAHGFHFYKGAKKTSWILYYPIEKFCSRFTDKLITINQEDYQLAKSRFKAKEICYVPGVGIDLSRFENIQVDKNAKRSEIGVPENSFLLFSVGELNQNKNHQLVIKAIAKLNNPTIHYAIAGVGENKECLLELMKELGVSEQVHLLGYRTDVMEIYRCVDAFVFPSIREGLSVSLMEAMASGLVCIVSNIRGNVDLVDKEGEALFTPYSVDDCSQAITYAMCTDVERVSQVNKDHITNFSISNVLAKMNKIYFE